MNDNNSKKQALDKNLFTHAIFSMVDNIIVHDEKHNLPLNNIKIPNSMKPLYNSNTNTVGFSSPIKESDKTDSKSNTKNLNINLNTDQIQINTSTITKINAVFLCFINKKSGGNLGQQQIDKLDKNIVLGNEINGKKFEKYKEIHIDIYNLCDSDNKTVGLKKAHAITNDHSNYDDIFMVAGGGDGSICWVLEELISFNVNFQKVTFGHLPFGTGNDFSIACGFGPNLPSEINSNPQKGLLIKIKVWLESDRKLFDIWDTELVCNHNGRIMKIEKNEKGFTKEPLKYFDNVQGEDRNCLHYKRKMSNYASQGIDARVGFGFDKKRTTNRILNKLVYGWEGIKKFLSKPSDMNKVIDSMSIIDEFNSIHGERAKTGQTNSQVKKLKEIVSQSPSINLSPKVFDFITEPENIDDYRRMNYIKNDIVNQSETNKSEHKDLEIDLEHIKKNAIQKSQFKNMENIVSKNAEQIQTPNQNRFYSHQLFKTQDDNTKVDKSCCTGSKNKEKKDKNLLDIDPVNFLALNIPSYAGGCEKVWDTSKPYSAIINDKSKKSVLSDKQSFGDGKMEFVGFTNRFSLGVFERAIHGLSSRIAQGEGPFLMKFKKNKDGKDLVTYYQVDGEYFQIVNPLYQKFSKTHDLPFSKIVVLCSKNSN